MQPNIPERIGNQCPSADATRVLEVYRLAVCWKFFRLNFGIGVYCFSSWRPWWPQFVVMVPFLVFNGFRGSIPKPSANPHGVLVNQIDLVSYPATGWPYHCQESRSERAGVTPKLASKWNQAEAPYGARKGMWHQTGRKWRRCQLGQCRSPKDKSTNIGNRLK